MVKSRLKRGGMKRIVFDNLIDSRTGKKASIVVPASLDVGSILRRAEKDAKGYSRDLNEMGSFVAQKGDCPGKLWVPKNLEEVTARANAAGARLKERFGRP